MNEDNDTLEKRWYVIQTHSGFENAVKKALEQRVADRNLEHKFGELLIPTEEIVEMRDGQKKKSERKFFPGYVLAFMVMDDETWYLVSKTAKVVGFIGSKGSDGKPPPISEQQIQQIIKRVKEVEGVERPKVVYQSGEVVRVKEGPFADFTGVVEEVNYEKNRLRVAVLIFGRSTPVELEFSQVEKG